MRRNILPMAIALSAMYMSIAACNGTGGDAQGDDSTGAQGPQTEQIAENQKDAVPYKVAENYFVNNSVKDSIPAKITTKEQFDTYFGMASTMGANGKPTPIDFDNQYVIVVDHPTTRKKTELIPVSLINHGTHIEFNYKETVGEEMSFSIHPLLILIVNNQYSSSGGVVLHKN